MNKNTYKVLDQNVTPYRFAFPPYPPFLHQSITSQAASQGPVWINEQGFCSDPRKVPTCTARSEHDAHPRLVCVAVCQVCVTVSVCLCARSRVRVCVCVCVFCVLYPRPPSRPLSLFDGG